VTQVLLITPEGVPADALCRLRLLKESALTSAVRDQERLVEQRQAK
jgi:hypothetical protein